MKINRAMIYFAVFCLILICWNPALMADDKKINIKMAAFFGEQSPAFKVMYQWPAEMKGVRELVVQCQQRSLRVHYRLRPD